VFEDFSNDDAADLIAEYPLAWLYSRSGGEEASLLPLLADRDQGGTITRLIGHMARTNPLHQRLAEEPRALILFQGPQAYVSPAIVGRRDWAPTWNFAQLRIDAEIVFHETGDEALSLLVDTMEEGQEHPWRVEEIGKRYRQMERSIIGFDANVLSLHGRFKLGQDETAETLKAICANHPDQALVRWMKRFNEGRY
jgi:transcriptional regulator